MAENKANRAAEAAQEPPKKAYGYKITCGTFQARNEALQRAAEARRAGVPVSLTIGKGGYTLVHAEGMSKEEADAEKREIEAKKVKAEISEQ